MPATYKTCPDAVALHLIQEPGVAEGSHRAVVIAETTTGAYVADIFEAPTRAHARLMAAGTYGRGNFKRVVDDFSQLNIRWA